MIGHVLIEGNSIARGYGADPGQGFDQLLDGYFRALSPQLAVRNAQGNQDDCVWTYVHSHGQPDYQPANFVHSLRHHIATARSLNSGHHERLIGIFVIGGRADHQVEQWGDRRAYLQNYRDSLEDLQDECSRMGIIPFLVESPQTTTDILRYSGKLADPELQAGIRRYNARAAASMEVPLIYFEGDIVPAAERLAYMHADGVHPNASGYKRMFEYLLPLICQNLGLPEPLSRPLPIEQSK